MDITFLFLATLVSKIGANAATCISDQALQVAEAFKPIVTPFCDDYLKDTRHDTHGLPQIFDHYAPLTQDLSSICSCLIHRFTHTSTATLSKRSPTVSSSTRPSSRPSSTKSPSVTSSTKLSTTSSSKRPSTISSSTKSSTIPSSTRSSTIPSSTKSSTTSSSVKSLTTSSSAPQSSFLTCPRASTATVTVPHPNPTCTATAITITVTATGKIVTDTITRTGFGSIITDEITNTIRETTTDRVTATVTDQPSGTPITDIITDIITDTVTATAPGTAITDIITDIITDTITATAPGTDITDTITNIITDTITASATEVTDTITTTLTAPTVTATVTSLPQTGESVDQSGCPATNGGSSFQYIIHCSQTAGSGSFAAGTNPGYNIQDCSSQCYDNAFGIDCLGTTYTPPAVAFNGLDGALQPGTCTFYEFISFAGPPDEGVVLAVFEDDFFG